MPQQPLALNSLSRDLYKACAEGQILVKDSSTASGTAPADAGGGGNPFDQDLNTTNVVQHAGLGIGIAGVAGKVTMAQSGGVATLDFLNEAGDGIASQLQSADSGGVLTLSLFLPGTSDGITFSTGADTPSQVIGNYGVKIITDQLDSYWTWLFNPDGSMTAPGPVSASGYTGASLTAAVGALDLLALQGTVSVVAGGALGEVGSVFLESWDGAASVVHLNLGSDGVSELVGVGDVTIQSTTGVIAFSPFDHVDINGGLNVDGLGDFGEGAKVPVTAIGSLPTCDGASEGTIRGVNDALLPAALAVVAAGGSVHVPVYCDGANWRVM